MQSEDNFPYFLQGSCLKKYHKEPTLIFTLVSIGHVTKSFSEQKLPLLSMTVISKTGLFLLKTNLWLALRILSQGKH